MPRYAKHPAMFAWGTWDGISTTAGWAIEGRRELPPYNGYTIDRYRAWLRERFTLDDLNEYLMRRFASWEAAEPACHPDAFMDMLLYQNFHREKVANHLGWLADLTGRLDSAHEQRSHGASFTPKMPLATDTLRAASRTFPPPHGGCATTRHGKKNPCNRESHTTGPMTARRFVSRDWPRRCACCT